MEKEQTPIVEQIEEQEEQTVESRLSEIAAKVLNATEILQKAQTEIEELYELLPDLHISDEGETTE